MRSSRLAGHYLIVGLDAQPVSLSLEAVSPHTVHAYTMMLGFLARLAAPDKGELHSDNVIWRKLPEHISLSQRVKEEKCATRLHNSKFHVMMC